MFCLTANSMGVCRKRHRDLTVVSGTDSPPLRNFRKGRRGKEEIDCVRSAEACSCR